MCPSKMYLVFEYLEMDLKKRMEMSGISVPFLPETIKSYIF